MIRNEFARFCLMACTLFAIAALVLKADDLVDVCNGMFLGVFVTLCMVYWRTGMDAVRGHGPYSRVQHFALGCAFVWISFAGLRTIGVLAIHWPQMFDWMRSSYPLAFIEWIAIFGGIMQITAPGMKSGYMHGRDSRWLFCALLLGALVSVWAFTFVHP